MESSSVKDKNQISLLLKITSFLLGVKLLANFNVIININWENLINEMMGSILNFLTIGPELAVIFLIPIIARYIRQEIMIYVSFAFDVLLSILYPFTFPIKSKFGESAGIATLITLTTVSSILVGVYQALWFSQLSAYSLELMEYLFWGMAFSGLAVTVYFLLVNLGINYLLRPNLYISLAFGFAIVLHLLGLFSYIYVNKRVNIKSDVEKKAVSSEKQSTIPLSVYISAAKKNLSMLVYNFLMYFTHFIVFPGCIFNLISPTEGVKNLWGTIIFLIVAIMENVARFMSSIQLSIVKRTFKRSHLVYILAIKMSTLAILPIWFNNIGLLGKNIFQGVGPSILVVAIFAFGSFLLGLLGNAFGGEVCRDLTPIELEVIGSLITFTILFGIVMGMLTLIVIKLIINS